MSKQPWELEKEWVSSNQIWKVLAFVRATPGHENREDIATRDVKVYKNGKQVFDHDLYPQYVKDKYKEFTTLIYTWWDDRKNM